MKPSQKEVNEILQNYDLGEFKSIKALSHGFANLSYKLVTTQGVYLFRICKEKSSKELELEIKILNKLKKIKFPTAFPIAKLDGEYINFSKKYGEIILYDFIEGKEPKANNQTVQEIAKAVAKLNSIKNTKTIERENALTIKLCKSLIRKFKNAKHKYPKIFEFFKEHVKALEKPLQVKVPKGLVHGDVFTDNTIFKGNKLKAIVDFEEVCVDNLLFDVAMTINGFCFKNNKLDQKLMDIFLKEYNKVRKMSSKELSLLMDYIKWTALATIAWHLKHLLVKREKCKLDRVNYLMNRIIGIT